MAFISNLEGVIEEMRKKALKKTDVGITKRYKNMVTNVLYDLAMNTPQWSGDLAASWQVLVGRKNQTPQDINTGLKLENYEEVDPLQWIGSPKAVDIAMSRNAAAIASIRWNSIVSIQNVNENLPEIYDDGRGEGKLRKGNFIPGDIMAVKYVQLKYSMHLGGYSGSFNVSPRTGEIA